MGQISGDYRKLDYVNRSAMTPLFRQPSRLTAKIPMQQKVLGEHYDLYQYQIINKKVYYTFLYFIRPEDKQLKH